MYIYIYIINKIAILLKIVSMLINFNWKIIKNDKIKKYCCLKKRSNESKGPMKAFTTFIKPF